MQQCPFGDCANADNIGGDKYKSLLAEELKDFTIEDRVELITPMVRAATKNKDDLAKLAIFIYFSNIIASI